MYSTGYAFAPVALDIAVLFPKTTDNYYANLNSHNQTERLFDE
jgi:hypothetical protein